MMPKENTNLHKVFTCLYSLVTHVIRFSVFKQTFTSRTRLGVITGRPLLVSLLPIGGLPKLDVLSLCDRIHRPSTVCTRVRTKHTLRQAESIFSCLYSK